jgi:hypothetical protein
MAILWQRFTENNYEVFELRTLRARKLSLLFLSKWLSLLRVRNFEVRESRHWNRFTPGLLVPVLRPQPFRDSLPATGVPQAAVDAMLEIVDAEAAQLRLKLDGGWPWETFQTERTILSRATCGRFCEKQDIQNAFDGAGAGAASQMVLRRPATRRPIPQSPFAAFSGLARARSQKRLLRCVRDSLCVMDSTAANFSKWDGHRGVLRQNSGMDGAPRESSLARDGAIRLVPIIWHAEERQILIVNITDQR